MNLILRYSFFVLFLLCGLPFAQDTSAVAAPAPEVPAQPARVSSMDSLTMLKLNNVNRINATRQDPVSVEPISPGALALRMGLGLMVVLGLIYGSWRLAKRMKGVAEVNAPARNLQLLEALPLGQNRRVILVRAGTKVLVVGDSDAGLSGLSELVGEDAKAVLDRVETIGPTQFAATVDQLLSRFRRDAGGKNS